MDTEDKLRQIQTDVLQRVSPEQAWHYQFIPYSFEKNQLFCFISDAKVNIENIAQELEILLGWEINLSPLAQETLQRYLGLYYRLSEQQRSVSTLQGSKDSLNDLILEAQQLNCSDIHIEAYEEKNRIRFRIDGELMERYILDKQEYPGLVNKIKIKANLDIAEKRLPQDGRIIFEHGHVKFDIRVSVLPTLYGEKVVMRLLRSNALNLDLYKLGFSDKDLETYLEGTDKETGMLLISGPTGSGKTTTLYATLQLLNKTSRNILTIEDPIEYTIEGINQVQLKEAIGLDFAATIRTFMRQDPNIIMVGEIRDRATAEMAMRTSLTGHLVFSTIHTNSAWGIVARLIDMGIPSYLLADTLNTAVAQRLVRLLCPHCKYEAAFDEKLLPRRYKPAKAIRRHWLPKGCEHCHFTGYKGRSAIYEVIGIDEELSERIKNEELNVGALLKSRGLVPLSENAFSLVESGATSIKEVFAILSGG
jgi:general secretion pathway protein E/type IV pilus assembly protein PilB